jgi:hypothetical protein
MQTCLLSLLFATGWGCRWVLFVAGTSVHVVWVQTAGSHAARSSNAERMLVESLHNATPTARGEGDRETCLGPLKMPP